MAIVNKGERVKFYSPDGMHTGVIEEVEMRNGSPYASIKSDDSENICYLNYGAVEGFEKLDDNPHPWSPIMMARYRLMRLI